MTLCKDDLSFIARVYINQNETSLTQQVEWIYVYKPGFLKESELKKAGITKGLNNVRKWKAENTK